MNFQEMILALQQFWAEQGCVIWNPYNVQVGAGTNNPATLLRVLGPEPWRVAYVEPSIRPDDGRYGDNPNRMQRFLQYQVILKPEPGNPQELYLESLAKLGIHARDNDIRFRRRQLAEPATGRLGSGLGGLAQWPGDRPIHLFPAGSRLALRPGFGGDHLWSGAHGDGDPGGGFGLGYPLAGRVDVWRCVPSRRGTRLLPVLF